MRSKSCIFFLDFCIFGTTFLPIAQGMNLRGMNCPCDLGEMKCHKIINIPVGLSTNFNLSNVVPTIVTLVSLRIQNRDTPIA